MYALKIRNSIALFAISLLLVVACQKDKDRQDACLEGKTAAKVSFRLLSLSHILQHFCMPYDSRYLPPHCQIHWVDSIGNDSSGFTLRVNLGNGITCRDGMLRKGAFNITLSDTGYGYDHKVSFTSIAADSFAMLSADGWEFVTGSMKWIGLNQDSALQVFNLKISGKNGQSLFQSAGPLVWGLQREGAFANWQHRYTISGVVSLQIPGHNFSGTFRELSSAGGCFSNWTQGWIDISAAAEGKKGSTVWMDPLGDAACDMVFKVAAPKEKVGLTEEMYKAW